MTEKRLNIGLRIPSWCMAQDAILMGIVDYVQEYDKQWHLEVPRKSDGELPEVVIDKDWCGDGLISFRYTKEELSSFRERGVAHVNISSVIADGEPSVVIDSYQVGVVAAEHLLNLGLRSFVFIGRLDREYSQKRKRGFLAALEKAKMTAEVYDLEVNDLPVGQRANYMEQKLRSLLPEILGPVGVFTTDDLLAANTMRVARSLKIKIPGSLAIVGFTGDPIFCMSTTPSLTSVRYPAREVGYAAAQKLDRMLCGTDEELQTVISVKSLEPRESTNMFAFKDERLKQAMCYIQEKAPHEPLLVSDVCGYLRMSKSTLKELMGRELGRSPKAEISRVRKVAFARYLEDTELSIKEIAYLMGFPAAEEASRFFKRETGKTPTQFRIGL